MFFQLYAGKSPIRTYDVGYDRVSLASGSDKDDVHCGTALFPRSMDLDVEFVAITRKRNFSPAATLDESAKTATEIPRTTSRDPSGILGSNTRLEQPVPYVVAASKAKVQSDPFKLILIIVHSPLQCYHVPTIQRVACGLSDNAWEGSLNCT